MPDLLNTRFDASHIFLDPPCVSSMLHAEHILPAKRAGFSLQRKNTANISGCKSLRAN
ncbi:hypothetical protein BACCAP_01199 [Pseudoflavonifractor capillosus ATCC 29799]|uniref:Uncharacterized protein n=1 Tax=Pseudoflavonifractor capillosus ATCC 29799 TaxID=411467 RepID=A6NSM1_9FIRM|nr:hypothetical protein BACCAP_01199 [Pseudoflavonifractor capillosus ATCC 29799]